MAAKLAVSNRRARARVQSSSRPTGELEEFADRGRRAQAAADEITAEHRRTIELEQRKLEGDLAKRAGAKTRAREAAAKRSSELDRAIALAVSSAPARPDWYDHPGPLPRDRVMAAAGLRSGMELHRIMERYRASTIRKGARR